MCAARSLVLGQRLAQLLQLLLIAFAVIVFVEQRVTRMGAADAARVLNRAPVLLGECRNLARIGDESVDIGAIRPVELFKRVGSGFPRWLTNWREFLPFFRACCKTGGWRGRLPAPRAARTVAAEKAYSPAPAQEILALYGNWRAPSPIWR